jgi:hypothetical protein
MVEGAERERFMLNVEFYNQKKHELFLKRTLALDVDSPLKTVYNNHLLEYQMRKERFIRERGERK